MSYKDNIDFNGVAKVIFNMLPKEILDETRKNALGKDYVFREEFVKHCKKCGFGWTRFSDWNDLEKRIACIIEEWLKGKEKFSICMFDELFFYPDVYT